jgi:hypothetical protein
MSWERQINEYEEAEGSVEGKVECVGGDGVHGSSDFKCLSTI